MQKNVCVELFFSHENSYECDFYLNSGASGVLVEFNSLPIHTFHGFCVKSQEDTCHEYTILETTTDVYSPMFAVCKEEVLYDLP